MVIKKLLKPLKLISVAKKAGVVTVLYPYQKPLITSEFRGKISIDPSKCMACGACVNVCPPNALTLSRQDNVIIINYFIGRCIFCGRCAEVCPVGAITVTHEFELATTRIDDLNSMLIHKLRECPDCESENITERMKQFVMNRTPAAENYIDLCPECRKKRFYTKVALRRGIKIEEK